MSLMFGVISPRYSGYTTLERREKHRSSIVLNTGSGDVKQFFKSSPVRLHDGAMLPLDMRSLTRHLFP